MSVRVVTDSACDLPQDAGRALRHRDRPAHDPLRQRGARRPRGARAPTSSGSGSRASTVLPETAAPSAGAFEATFRGLVDDGADRHRVHQPVVAAVGARCRPPRSPPTAVDGDVPGRGRSTRMTCRWASGNLCLTAAERGRRRRRARVDRRRGRRPARPHEAVRRRSTRSSS